MGRYIETLFLYRQGTEHLNRGEYRLAAQAFRRAITRFETNDVLHFHLGLALALLGEWEAAAPAFRRALELNPASVDALYGLALALWVRGEGDSAEAHYRRALAQVKSSGVPLSPMLKRLAQAIARIPPALRRLELSSPGDSLSV